jgi:preprotein translocase subunit YajC
MNKNKITAKEALMQIGKLLKMDFAKIEKFNSAKLKDGTEVMWEGDLSEGSAIMVVSEDGNQMPAPDKVHELEDGTKVTTVGGLVTAIEGKEKEKEEVEVEMADDTMAKIEERMASCESKMAEMETKMSEMFGKFTAIDETIANTTKSANEKFEAIKVIIDEISEEPIIEQPKPKHSTFSKSDKKKNAVEMMAAYKKFTNQN